MDAGASVDGGAGAPVGEGERLAALDFIRGVAVLGILFANIVAFGHALIAYSWPGGLPRPMSGADTAVWLVQFLLVDGKMRGLFTLLFGAGIALFMDRAWARGRSVWLQVRRLVLLGLIGLAHFFLLFWGDILFLYALAGLAVLPAVRWGAEVLLRAGIVWYVAGAIWLGVSLSGAVVLEQSPTAQVLAAEDFRAIKAAREARIAQGQAETAAYAQGSYRAEVAYVATEQVRLLGQYAYFALLETIPLMLIGMALYRFGLFSGAFPAPVLRRWGWIGVGAGLALQLPLALWPLARGFPLWLTEFASSNAAQLPRLPMVVGLAALLAAWAPAAIRGWLGQRFAAAGRMALSNYVGTSLVMMLVFRQWAGGLWGELSRVELLGPMLLGWVLILAWSKPWLARFRYGPLEWLWRCLTYGKILRFRR